MMIIVPHEELLEGQREEGTEALSRPTSSHVK